VLNLIILALVTKLDLFILLTSWLLIPFDWKVRHFNIFTYLISCHIIDIYSSEILQQKLLFKFDARVTGTWGIVAFVLSWFAWVRQRFGHWVGFCFRILRRIFEWVFGSTAFTMDVWNIIQGVGNTLIQIAVSEVVQFIQFVCNLVVVIVLVSIFLFLFTIRIIKRIYLRIFM